MGKIQIKLNILVVEEFHTPYALSVCIFIYDKIENDNFSILFPYSHSNATTNLVLDVKLLDNVRQVK
jgi:hypothetical protein